MLDSPSLKRTDFFALLFAMIFPTFATWLYFVALAGHESMRFVYFSCKLLQFSFPIVWVTLIQQQPIRLHLPDRRGAGLGLLFGLIVLAAMLPAYHGYLKQSPYLRETPGLLWQKITDIGCDTPGRFFIMAIFIAVVHSFLEEYYWRWFVFGQLRRGLRPGAAMILSSAAFAAHHVIVVASYMKGETALLTTIFFSLAVGLGGMAWAWIYDRGGSLSGPWLSHLLVDAGLMWIGYDLCRSHFP